MIVKTRRRRTLGQDDSSSGLDFSSQVQNFQTLGTSYGADFEPGSSLLYNPPTLPVSAPTLSPIAPGLSTSDLVPPAGVTAVTSSGNIINSSGQILGIIDNTSGKPQAILEPGLTPQTAGTSGGLLDISNLTAGVGKALASFLGAKPVTSTPATAGGAAASGTSTPLIPGVPNTYLAIGAGIFAFVLILSAGRRR